MKPKINERTLNMKREYVRLHNEGYTPSEIAKKYDLSLSTIYKSLEEIARKAGVTRESLLERPIEADHSGRCLTYVQPVNVSQIREHFTTAQKELENLIQEVEKVIKAEEDIKEEE